MLIDAFVVRMTLVPAALTLVGRAAWGLGRTLPALDVEGQHLRHADPPTHRQPVGALSTME